MAETAPLSKRPEDTPFKQQKLASWQPVLTPIKVILIFILIGIIFVPVGTTLMTEADNVYDQTIIYDGHGAAAEFDCSITQQNQNKNCVVDMTFTEDVSGPVYVYYSLKNYYQNHRRYVKSRSATQLEGANLAEGDVSLDCDPLVKNGTMLLNPCGLVANSFFNDVITLQTAPAGVTMDESGITWSSDNSRFKQVEGYKEAEVATGTNTVDVTDCNTLIGGGVTDAFPFPYDGNRVGSEPLYCVYYPDNGSVQYLYETYPNQISPLDGVTDPHFIVWMRTAGLPSFRKLYGKINSDFSAGDTLSFAINLNFEVDSYDASKGLTLSTVGRLGGKNPFIGVAYIVVGSISFFLAALFGTKYFLDPRRQGSADYLHWD